MEEQKKKYHKIREDYLNKYVKYDGYWMRKKNDGLELQDVIGPRITLGLIQIIKNEEWTANKEHSKVVKMIAEKAEEEVKNNKYNNINLNRFTWKQPTYRHVDGGILIERSPTQPDHWNEIDSWEYPTDELPELDEELDKELVKDLDYKKRVADGIHVGPERSVGPYGGRKRTRRKKRRRRIKSTKKKRRRKRKRTKKKRKRRRR